MPHHTGESMAKYIQHNLFTWQEIEVSSDLDRLKLVLDVIPDEKLMVHLEKDRGHGRDDYPVRPMWNALIAGIVFNHPSIASLARELWRNGELRHVCGFEPGRPIPTQDALERLAKMVLDHRHYIDAMFKELVEELGKLLPDLGQKLAMDSKAIPSHGRPVRDESKQKEPDGRRDLDADWGNKTSKGVREDGTVWEKVKRWFGYKLHLLVDSTHELPLTYKVTRASAGDSPELLPMVRKLGKDHPRVAERAEELAADKAYDSGENKRELFDEMGINPIIDTRHLWKDEPTQSRSLFPDRCDVFTYDESGRLYCHCPVTGEKRDLFFCGFERERGTLKYRCPAAAYDLNCKGRTLCEAMADVGSFGRTVRVPLDLDRRIFTPVAHPTAKWKRAYARRTAVERVNSRIDLVLGFERHYIRGLYKMRCRISFALVIMLAMALGRIRKNQADLMRSMTAPVKRVA